MQFNSILLYKKYISLIGSVMFWPKGIKLRSLLKEKNFSEFVYYQFVTSSQMGDDQLLEIHLLENQFFSLILK